VRTAIHAPQKPRGSGGSRCASPNRNSPRTCLNLLLLALLLTLLTGIGHAQVNWQGDWMDGGSVVDESPLLAQRSPLSDGSSQRRIRVFPRSSVGAQGGFFPSDDGRESIGVIDSGVNIIIDNFGGFDTVDIAADRIVIWTTSDQALNIDGDSAQRSEAPLEFYMEGNIVFRQQDRVIYAERMYYNVREEYGVVLDGELLTPIPGYEGLVRLKAEVLRQVDPFHIEGFGGAVTTSRLGVPRYWLQSSSFAYESLPAGPVESQSVNPLTGTATVAGSKRIVSRDNRVYLAEVPVFYWPSISANLERPTFYLESFQLNNDQVFGTQVLTEWNLYQLLGWRSPPSGTNWTASVDYLSERGFGLGSFFEYNRNNFLVHTGPVYGFLDIWGINDSGLDNLGAGRLALEPEADLRGRILGRHRQQLAGGYEITGELGWISDRNFLEQYYEEEWDQEKDQTTGIEFKRRNENRSWSVTGDVRVNDFFTQTNWLPRGDHFWISQPLLSEWLSWTEHSSIGYANLRVAEPPADPGEALRFDRLAWEAEREGVRATTRHRLDLPLQWGGGKIVPYALGEASYWQEDLAGNEIDRLYGQLGIRASLPMVRVDPTVQSQLFNLNGMAHKVIFESDFFWADASANFTDLPLYDPLDDDAIEFFRRRFLFSTFDGVPGGDIPLRFDERFYALRSGMQRWVTAPSAEIADDLMLWRLAARQRWQTKRGTPGRQRVVDWITLDLEGTLYPNADRDNFGSEVGLLNYDLRWHVGDRFTLLSDGMADFFADGLRTVSAGAMLSRPGLGRYVFGIRNIEGPISSSILYGATSYRLSPKWILNYGSTFDLGETGNIGQRGQIVRVGESFLVGLGFNYDNSRDNFGVQFSIEPRFLSGRLSQVGGIPIAPVGVAGLE
jgi:hypothetical protein